MRAARSRSNLGLALVAGLGLGLGLVAPASAEDDYAGGSVIFSRDGMLYRTDPRGRAEAEIAKLPTTGTVRALRTDARGKVLLADIDGKWSWMPLDGSRTTLAELPCADGPAQLTADGVSVLCRSATDPSGSVIVNLVTTKVFPVAIPTPGARIFGTGTAHRLVWADATGVWSSPAGAPLRKTKVAPEAPVRSFLPSPDGSRGVGVYAGEVHVGKQTKPAELLMNFALDGQAARRKAIKEGVPIDWSHDNRWVLLQDRGSACIMSALGGQYKCWKGYTGVSISNDGRWALVLGDRNKGSDDDKASKKTKSSKDQKSPKQSRSSRDDTEPSGEAENREGEDAAPIDDIEVPPPSGPVSLYRAKLEGAYTTAPSLIMRIVDGAAVWIPDATRR